MTHEINRWPTFLPYAGLTESRWQVEEADRLCNTRFLQEDKSWSYITDCMGIEWDGAEQAQLWCYLTEGGDVKI